MSRCQMLEFLKKSRFMLEASSQLQLQRQYEYPNQQAEEAQQQGALAWCVQCGCTHQNITATVALFEAFAA